MLRQVSTFSNFFCNLTHCSLHAKLYSYNLHYNQLNTIFENPNAFGSKSKSFFFNILSSTECNTAGDITFTGGPEMGFQHP